MVQCSIDGDTTGFGDRELIEQITVLEQLKSVCSAVQAKRTAQFAASREAHLATVTSESKMDSARRDIGAQVGLARRVSPRMGSRLVGLAKVLTSEMPCTLQALREGRIDEFQATLIVGETSSLSREHRRAVDLELAGRLGGLTTWQAKNAAAGIGYRLDPAQAVKRTRKAEADRCVTLRPAPDAMTYVTALLPVALGVAVHAALVHHAAAAKATGDVRSRGALMADEFVHRLTTRATAAQTVDGDTALATVPAGVGIDIQLVMTDRTLLDGDHEPALLTGYGPIPATLARHLIRGAGAKTRVWVRRMYTDPRSGDLTGGDVRRRRFPHSTRQFLIARDQVCRTPWCGAPIRHADHVEPHAKGGRTALDNGAGLCEQCNQVKESPGWASRIDEDGGITVTTPTGHSYRSVPPPPPKSEPWPDIDPGLTEIGRRRLALLKGRAA